MKIDLKDKITRFVVQEYVNEICNYFNEEDLNFNIHKLIHTFDVVQMAQKLINLSKPSLSLKLQKQILNASVLHDLGRCHEFKDGVRLKNIDHGKIGSELIQKEFPKLNVEIQSTFYHNKLPSDKDPSFCYPVLDYVRDADMLANIEYEIEHIDVFMVHIFDTNFQDIAIPIIDDEIFQAVSEKRSVCIDRIKEKTLLTHFLWQLCWCFNLRTVAAKEFVRNTRLFEQFREMVCEKIVPMTTSDKKVQTKLKNIIHQNFSDELFYR